MPIDDPILYWPLDSDFNDVSGNDRHGTPIGSPAFITGRIGSGALRLNGVDQRVSFTSLNLGTVYTVAYWVFVQESGDGVICGGTNGNYAFYFDATTLYHSSGGGVDSVAHGGLTDGWHHLAVTRNGQGIGLLRFFKDGALLTSFVGNSNALDLASLGAYAGGTFWSQVDVDEFRIYDRPLSDAEVQELFEFTPTPPTPPQILRPVADIAAGGWV